MAFRQGICVLSYPLMEKEKSIPIVVLTASGDGISGSFIHFLIIADKIGRRDNMNIKFQ